ncbi:MAG TPA: peptidoglycan DD-metalloendopeptidase family protein [Acetobacteraceae bacterium]|nr:peptidoglycan DD-metalloendopeptidase family protein [Acetobacteraceae bacterium]
MGFQFQSGCGPAVRRLTRTVGAAALALAGFAATAWPAPGPLAPPVSPTCVTSPFGPRVLAGVPAAGTFHHGVDLRAPAGAVVRAVAAGQVIGIDRRGAGGLEVRVRHAGFDALYSHLGLLAPALLEGRRTLAAGEKIAVVARSGLTTGPHLYFEIIMQGQRVDPEPYLQIAPCR